MPCLQAGSAKLVGPRLFDEFEMVMDEIPMPGRRFPVPRPNWSQGLIGIPGERSFLTVRVKRIPTDCEKGFTVSPKRTRAVPGVSRRSVSEISLFFSRRIKAMAVKLFRNGSGMLFAVLRASTGSLRGVNWRIFSPGCPSRNTCVLVWTASAELPLPLIDPWPGAMP
jgi:hypothetical protein